MIASEPRFFDCRLYVSSMGPIAPALPGEHEPRKVVAFTPIEYEKLIDPKFRRLIEAFESLPGTYATRPSAPSAA